MIYVRHRYLDYNDNLLSDPDRFIESLTHDSIVVQIPFLTGHTRNRLERSMYWGGGSSHYMFLVLAAQQLLNKNCKPVTNSI